MRFNQKFAVGITYALALMVAPAAAYAADAPSPSQGGENRERGRNRERTPSREAQSRVGKGVLENTARAHRAAAKRSDDLARVSRLEANVARLEERQHTRRVQLINKMETNHSVGVGNRRRKPKAKQVQTKFFGTMRAQEQNKADKAGARARAHSAERREHSRERGRHLSAATNAEARLRQRSRSR